MLSPAENLMRLEVWIFNHEDEFLNMRRIGKISLACRIAMMLSDARKYAIELRRLTRDERMNVVREIVEMN